MGSRSSGIGVYRGGCAAVFLAIRNSPLPVKIVMGNCYRWFNYAVQGRTAWPHGKECQRRYGSTMSKLASNVFWRMKAITPLPVSHAPCRCDSLAVRPLIALTSPRVAVISTEDSQWRGHSLTSGRTELHELAFFPSLPFFVKKNKNARPKMPLRKVLGIK